MEGSFEALALIASRAAKCGAAQIVHATTTASAFAALFQLLEAKVAHHNGIPSVETDKEGRASILHLLTCLLHFATAAPAVFRHAMLHVPQAQQLFELILQPSSVDVLHLLDDPFGTVPLSKNAHQNANSTSMLPDQEHSPPKCPHVPYSVNAVTPKHCLDAHCRCHLSQCGGGHGRMTCIPFTTTLLINGFRLRLPWPKEKQTRRCERLQSV